MPRTPTGACRCCDKPMWTGTGSLPQGQATCRECRRANPTRTPRKKPDSWARGTCADCGGPASRKGTRCNTCHLIHCAATARAGKNSPARKAQRTRYGQTDSRAPGLNRYQRAQLLRSWQAKGRACTYCTRKATTVDHVVPLSRGGTNWEGNLTPACHRCNSGKAAKFLVEWRPDFLGWAGGTPASPTFSPSDLIRRDRAA